MFHSLYADLKALQGQGVSSVWYAEVLGTGAITAHATKAKALAALRGCPRDLGPQVAGPFPLSEALEEIRADIHSEDW